MVTDLFVLMKSKFSSEKVKNLCDTIFFTVICLIIYYQLVAVERLAEYGELEPEANWRSGANSSKWMNKVRIRI